MNGNRSTRPGGSTAPSRPHITQVDRDAIEDRGLVDDDRTPEMRKAPAATGALQYEPTTITKEKF